MVFFKNEQCINLCAGNVGPLSSRMIATLGGKAYEENACGIFALLFALSACSMNHQRRIEPLDGAQVSEIEQKINYGAPTENGLSQFYLRYHWNGTPQSILHGLRFMRTAR